MVELFFPHLSHFLAVRRAGLLRRLFAALCLFIVGGLFAVPSHASKTEASTSPGSAASVQQSFQRAAERWNVPVDVLLAVGYVESHWEQRGGEASLDNGYGIMHLVGGAGGTLERASQLTDLPVESLQTSASSNIQGGAAVLNDISQKLNKTQGQQAKVDAWFDVVAAYSGARDGSVGTEYAREVFRRMRDGATAKLASGETVTLPAGAVKSVPTGGIEATSSPDYDPALWVPANSGNYSVGRQYGPLAYIVIHDTEGSYSSAVNWFQNPSSRVSAHYVIRSSDGQITQMVRDANTAYQAGVWDYNVRSIGVEHEGFMSQTGWYTEAMYGASSALVATLADRYGVKKDRAHIIGHYQIPNQSHVDPGPNWNWNHYMSLVRHDSQRAGLIDNGGSGFSTVPSEVDPQHSWYMYGNGYSGSSSLSTLSASSPQASTNSATWTSSVPSRGYYDLYAFIPYVDNSTPDTANARYKVYTADGLQTASVSQKAITDVGTGSWAHVGRFLFNAGDVTVGLDDYTGETGRNVWFDAMMWIPSSAGGPPPTAQPTATRATTPVPPAPTRTDTPVVYNTPYSTPYSTPIAQATDTPYGGPTWTPGPCNIRFTDLPDTSWAYSYVVNLYCRNVVSGFSDGTYRPNVGNTRGQFTKMLVLGFSWTVVPGGVQRFSDVPLDSTYASFIETAVQQGVVSGYPDGTFRPNDPVTRAQAVKMIMIAHGWLPESPSSPTFTDIPPSHWTFGYVEGAYSHAIIGGYPDGTFRPQNSITRAQVAKTLTLATGPVTPAGPR